MHPSCWGTAEAWGWEQCNELSTCLLQGSPCRGGNGWYLPIPPGSRLLLYSTTQAWLDGGEGIPIRAEAPGRCSVGCAREAAAPQQELSTQSSRAGTLLGARSQRDQEAALSFPTKSQHQLLKGWLPASSWASFRCGQALHRAGELVHSPASGCGSNAISLLFPWGFDTKPVTLCPSPASAKK